jgi:HEAT repeat protein
MQDENADVRFAVAQALGDIGTESVVPVLAKALQDKDENVRVSAADAFLRIGAVAKPAKSVLIAALWDGNWYVRNKVAKTISKLGLEESDIPNLLEPWRGGFQPNAGALISLMLVVDSHIYNQVQDVLPFFIKALKNEDPRIRESAVIALKKIVIAIPQKTYLTKTTNELSRIIQDQNPKVRERAFETFGYILWKLDSLHLSQIPEREKARSALIQGLYDSEESARQTAFKSLLKASYSSNKSFSDGLSVNARFLDDISVDIVVEGLEDSDPDIRIEMDKYVDFINPTSYPYKDTIDKQTRQAIASALIPSLYGYQNPISYRNEESSNINILATNYKDEIVNSLNKGLQDPILKIRIDSALALRSMQNITPKDAAIIFSEGLNSEDYLIRLHTINGLKNLCSRKHKDIQGCLDGKMVLPLLIHALKDDSKLIRYAAALALVRIEPKKMLQEILIKKILKSIFKEETNPLLIKDSLKSINYLNDAGVSLNIFDNDNYYLLFASELGHFYDKQRRYSFGGDCYGRTPLLANNGNGVLELLTALNNQDIRFISAVTLAYNFSYLLKSDFSYYPINSTLQQKLAIDKLMLNQQNFTINKLILITKRSSELDKNHLFKKIFKLKNQDIRRSAIYVLGEIGRGIERRKDDEMEKENLYNQHLQTEKNIIEYLTTIVSDQNEEQNIRWMAAASLQKMNINLDQYFFQNKLINPRKVKTINLNTYSGPIFDPRLDFDIYSGELIYNPYAKCGGGLSEIYFALRNLFNNNKK